MFFEAFFITFLRSVQFVKTCGENVDFCRSAGEMFLEIMISILRHLIKINKSSIIIFTIDRCWPVYWYWVAWHLFTTIHKVYSLMFYIFEWISSDFQKNWSRVNTIYVSTPQILCYRGALRFEKIFQLMNKIGLKIHPTQVEFKDIYCFRSRGEQASRVYFKKKIF